MSSVYTALIARKEVDRVDGYCSVELYLEDIFSFQQFRGEVGRQLQALQGVYQGVAVGDPNA